MQSERRTQLWMVGIFLAVIVLVTAIAAFSSRGAATAPQNFDATVTAPITADDWARGPENAPVTLIEYGDFQCPACGAYEPLVQQLQQDYASQVRFVFRDFPLFRIHPNAMIAAQAAEAAGLQGKYWEMHDLLYEKQDEWADTPNDSVVNDHFNAYAQSLQLDVAKFDADIVSAAVINEVQSDIALGNDAKVDHTPTFFINLTQIPNPNNYEEFKAALDAAIASSTAQ